GIGPRDARPTRLELTWGGQEGMPLEEDNRFGTDEFLAWCALTGAEPYLNNSCRSVEEAVRWLEYTNYAGRSHYADLRRANGQAEPYGVKIWGLGNEAYGPWQMGHRSGEHYAADAREHALFMRKVDPTVQLVGVGLPHGAEGEAWTRALLRRAGMLIDYVSIHLYGASRHLFTSSAGEDEFESTVAQSLYFEQRLNDYATLVAREAERAGLSRPLALTLDEWNIRHLEPHAWPVPRPGDDGGIAEREIPPDAAAEPELEQSTGRRRLRVNRWSPRTAADALFYAGVFHALQRLAGHRVPVTMANTVNLVNANGLLAVRPGGLVKSATYHVWDLFQNRTGPIALPVAVDGPGEQRGVRQGAQTDSEGQLYTRPGHVPYLDVAATLSADRGALHLSVINRHRSRAITAQLVVDGRAANVPPRAEVSAIGHDVDDVLAVNTMPRPDQVALRDLGSIQIQEGHHSFPAHSVSLLTLHLRRD
ncbi:MAG TPA: alpha-L-arabinofuranosidase C-terminal domain-containing protein, partial [Chloroflexota bacterium]|nr:alpha-L-arabinofuranosidase C-terminal domain-containing protein [Chloroflexota bacterium]